MHILFLTDNFPPEVNAPASRTFEHASEWVRAGHRVTVVTCAPNFPKGRVFDGYRNRLWQREKVTGIDVIRVWSYISANEGFARRIFDYVSYMVTGLIAALFVRRPDVIVATSPQFFTAVAGRIASTLKRVPWVFELRDIWPESITAVGAMQQSRVVDWLEWLELRLYAHATRIVAVTNAFRETLVHRGVKRSKIDVVTNGVALGHYAPIPKDVELEAKFGLKGSFVAGYIGTHGLAHALETLLDAAALLKARGEQITILLLGDGARKASLVADAQARGLDNVLFLDTVSKDQVARYWSLLDVSVIHLRRTELFESVIPSKMFESMAMGIPIAMGLTGEAAEMVVESNAGELFPPEDAAALAALLIRLRTDRALYDRYSTAAVTAAKRYDRRILASAMLDSLEKAAAR